MDNLDVFEKMALFIAGGFAALIWICVIVVVVAFAAMIFS